MLWKSQAQLQKANITTSTVTIIIIKKNRSTYFDIKYLETLIQSTPSGTRMVETVGVLFLGSGTYILRPRVPRPSCSFLAQASCLDHRDSRPSSQTIARASLSAYTALIGPVWWYLEWKHCRLGISSFEHLKHVYNYTFISLCSLINKYLHY